jgi:hypothetical protein
MFKRLLGLKEQEFDHDKFIVRILADVDDVDPSAEFTDSIEIKGDVPDDFDWDSVKLISEPFLPGIFVQLCREKDDGLLQWMTEKDVSASGKSGKELIEFAIGSMNRRFGSRLEVRRTQFNGPDGELAGEVYFPLCDGIMPSSLVFVDAVWEKSPFKKDEVAIGIPDRDSLYFVKKSCGKSLDLLQQYIDLVWNHEDTIRKYRITRDILVADSDTVSGWRPLEELH